MLRCSGEPDCTSTTPSDGELLSQYAETGDREAFEELVHRHERKLFGFLRKYLGDAQLAEDAFQATFLKVHLCCRQFQSGRKFTPWLYRIAVNQATDLLRQNRRHRALSLDRPGWSGGRGKKSTSLLDFLEGMDEEPHELMEAAEDRQRVTEALKQMPDRFRRLLDLVLLQGLKYREAAKLLGIPVGTVKSQMHQAIRRLQNQIVAPVCAANMRAARAG